MAPLTPLATPTIHMLQIRDVMLTKKMQEVGNGPKNLAILKQLQTHFKTKHEKGVGRPFPRVPAPLHPCYQSRLLLHRVGILAVLLLNLPGFSHC